jgi:hypothetical protein
MIYQPLRYGDVIINDESGGKWKEAVVVYYKNSRQLSVGEDKGKVVPVF